MARGVRVADVGPRSSRPKPARLNCVARWLQPPLSPKPRLRNRKSRVELKAGSSNRSRRGPGGGDVPGPPQRRGGGLGCEGCLARGGQLVRAGVDLKAPSLPSANGLMPRPTSLSPARRPPVVAGRQKWSRPIAGYWGPASIVAARGRPRPPRPPTLARRGGKLGGGGGGGGGGGTGGGGRGGRGGREESTHLAGVLARRQRRDAQTAWPSAGKPDGCGPRAKRAPAPAERTPPARLSLSRRSVSAERTPRQGCPGKALGTLSPQNFLPDLCRGM